MCGIVGFMGGNWSRGPAAARAQVQSMAACIGHRGPDGSASWQDDEQRIALGHNRLAILDLSPAGDQPMRSASGRYVIVYNGETYNHMELRRRLEEEGIAPTWRGHSDTETLLAGFEAWGIKPTLERSVGMFAFALWDRQERRLILARDRLGEKPLYYGWQGGGGDRTFLFGSELKALADHPSFVGVIDRQALTLYLRHAYVPAPYSIYVGMKKLLPGCLLTIGADEEAGTIEPYWSAAEAARNGVAAPLAGGTQDILDQLEQVLSEAVGRQMLADVPLGAFLSGGVDSSTIVALMQAQSSRPVKTFSIGFHEDAYNEAEHAGAVARHLGTEHSELYVTSADALSLVPDLPRIYDEPFADSSQIPTLLVSKLARKHVTVALSGDAGDEVFAGYNRYKMTDAYWRRLAMIPRPLRSLGARALNAMPMGAVNRLAEWLPGSRGMTLPGDKLIKAAGVLPSRSADELYYRLVSQWQDPCALVVGGHEPATALTGDMPSLQGLSDIERMMALDMLTYLPDDILAKVDRAAMSTSLETRVPFLDHKVVEFAWRMPMAMKLRDGETKWALRQILYRHVPKALIERPKMGFGVPIDSWLRGPLKAWAEDLLDEVRLRREGYLRPEPIRRAWDAHQSGRANLQYPLWAVLMFQSWLESSRQSSGKRDFAEPEMSGAGQKRRVAQG